MNDIDTLLDRLNEFAVYSDKVSIPIPLYEALRRILKEIKKSNDEELKALRTYLISRGLDIEKGA